MKKELLNFFLTMVLLTAYGLPFCTVAGASDTALSQEDALIAAFPGADGAGKFSTGGRGGEIYHVTSLADSGSGTLRAAVSKSDRIVVFDVGGTIELTSGDIYCNNNITIAGQTAPGGHGITIKGGRLDLDGNNIIVRFVNVRPGHTGTEGGALSGNGGSNSIIDHCSIGWVSGTQYALFVNSMKQTVQYSIIGPANNIERNENGIKFGKGMNSWHHNLIAHNIARSLRGKVEGTYAMDFVNNVVYNWGYQTTYGTYGQVNFVGNYFKTGPSTISGERFINIASSRDPYNFKFYFTGNKMVDKNDSGDSFAAMNADNWDGGIDYGTAGLTEQDYRTDTPLDVESGAGINASAADTADTAEEAYNKVTAYAGAAVNSESRTEADAAIINETVNGTGSLSYDEHIEITDEVLLARFEKYNVKPIAYEYPERCDLNEDYSDTDADGMPDEWETERGLDPEDPRDALDDYLGVGYNNIEYYINDLTVDAFPKGVVTKSKTAAELGEEYLEAKRAAVDGLDIALSKSISDPVDIDLPESSNGCDISWYSSSSVITIENNEVTEIARSYEHEVNTELIAVINAGSRTFKKVFNVTVAPTIVKWYPSDDYLMEGLECPDGELDYEMVHEFDVYGNMFTSCASSNLTFTPPYDGFLCLYLTNLSEDGGSCYVTETEGGGIYDEGVACGSQGEDGDGCLITAPLYEGKKYYIYQTGTTGKLAMLTFNSVAPTMMWMPSADVKMGDELVHNLWAMSDMSFTKRDHVSIDGIAMHGYLEGTENPGGNVMGQTGSALKYTAEIDGSFKVFYKVSTGKTFRITDSTGAIIETYTNEEVYEAPEDPNDDPISIGESEYTSSTINVKAGATYYIYVKASKGDFFGVSFVASFPSDEEETETTPEPLYWRTTGDIAPDNELAPDSMQSSLSIMAGEDMKYGVKEATIAGVDFPGCVVGTNDPFYQSGSFSGAYLKVTPKTTGTVTVYARLNAGKELRIVDSNNSILKSYTPLIKINTSLSYMMKANTTYYIYANGSKAYFFGIRFVPRVMSASDRDDPDIGKATPPPVVPVTPTVSFGSASLTDGTLTITAVGSPTYDVYAAQYNSAGELTGVVKKNPGRFTIEVAEQSEIVKVFIWKENIPVVSPGVLSR